MLVTLLCPEYVTWIAFEQWQRARKYKEVCKLGYKEWTLKHGFYVDMGGYQVLLKERCSKSRVGDGIHDISQLEDGSLFTIRLEDLILLLEADLLPLPNIHIHDLLERSKNDLFAQVVTALQVLHFVVYTFGRLGSNLPISTLEISTLAFACCAAFIEFFWWSKPLDLRTTTVTTLNPTRNEQFISILPKVIFNPPEQDLAESSDMRRFFDRVIHGKERKRSLVHAVWIGCIFNSIHIFAWNFSFASEYERLLWHIASVGACGAITLAWAATFIRPKTLGFILAGLSATFYCICRIYLMVEVFVGLRSVPATLYRSSAWQNALPGV